MIHWGGRFVKYLPELALKRYCWGVGRTDVERVGEPCTSQAVTRRSRACAVWGLCLQRCEASGRSRWGKPLEEVKSTPRPGPSDSENGDVSDQSMLSSETAHVHESKAPSAQSPGTWPCDRWAAGVSGHTDFYLNMPRWSSSGAFQHAGGVLWHHHPKLQRYVQR